MLHSKKQTLSFLSIGVLTIIFTAACSFSPKTGLSVEQNDDLLVQNIYSTTKSEFSKTLKNHTEKLRSSDNGVNTISSLDLSYPLNNTFTAKNRTEYNTTIATLQISDQLKKILLLLPDVFFEKTQTLTIDYVKTLDLSQEEKAIASQVVGMVDALKDSEYYYYLPTLRGNEDSREARYAQAMEDCYVDYCHDLGRAVGEACVSGLLGAYGGPVVAGVSLAAVGAYKVVEAYADYRKCVGRAERDYGNSGYSSAAQAEAYEEGNHHTEYPESGASKGSAETPAAGRN